MAGKTVAAQIRQAARHLGFAPDDWRPRELWYGRRASVATLLDPRERCRAWREREAARVSADQASALAGRIAEIRAGLARLDRELADVEAEVARLAGGALDA